MDETMVLDLMNRIGDAGCLVVSLFFLLQTVKTVMPIVEKMAEQHERHIDQIIKLLSQTNLGIAENREID